MDDVRREALLRLYAGQERRDICEDLGIDDRQLTDWEATTPTSDLRPAGLPFVTKTLRWPRGDEDA
jgi:hypothetical protein